MWNEELKKALLNVCKNHCYQNAENVIVPEPYLPYVPENWNKILVLAESQSSAYPQYWERVKKESTLERMQRLGKYREGVGIGPWDDGTIKLALQAIFEGANLNLKLEDVAVSNAVPWTRKSDDNRKNLRPDEQMEAKAAEFWKEFFHVWQPDVKVLVVLGNVAEGVMKQARILEKYRVLKLRLPSPNAINRVRGMFDCVDLKIRFPEVERALNTIEINEKQYKMKVFFACHAVSLGVSKFKNWFHNTNN